MNSVAARRLFTLAFAAAGGILLAQGLWESQRGGSVGTLAGFFLPFLVVGGLLVFISGASWQVSLTAAGRSRPPLFFLILATCVGLVLCPFVFWLVSVSSSTVSILIAGALVGAVLSVGLFLFGNPVDGFIVSLLVMPLLNLLSVEMPRSFFNQMVLGPVTLTPSLTLVLAGGLSFLPRAGIKPQPSSGQRWFLLAVLAFIALGLTSCLRPADRWASFNQALLDTLFPTFGFWIVLSSVRDSKEWNRCLTGLLLCAGELALLGLYFFVRPSPGNVDVRNFYGANLSVALPLSNLSIVLVLLLAPTLAWAAQLRSSKRWMLIALAMLFIGAITLSYTRSAQIAMVLSFALLLAIRRLRIWIVGAVTATVLIAVLWPQQFSDIALTRFTGMKLSAPRQDNDLSWRFEAWEGAWRLLKDHPAGVGAGQWSRYASAYTLPRDSKVNGRKVSSLIASPHNIFLDYAVETGWPGLAVMLFIFGYLLSRLPGGWHRKRTDPVRYACLVGLAAFLVCSFFAANFFSYGLNILPGLLFWAFAGLIIRIPITEELASPQNNPEELPA